MSEVLPLRAALASVSTALVLLALKAYAAAATASVAMLASLADTGLDLVASLVTLWGVQVARRPADAEHRYGHGKAEALAALFQVALIAISAAAIGWRAVTRLMAGGATRNAGEGILVSLAALVLTGALILYQRHVLARAASVAIRADNIHYQADLALNGAVIVALLLDRGFGLRAADPLLGIGIALFLAFGAWRAAAGAIDQLMDREWPEDRRRAFLEVAAREPELKGIHDLRTRTSGAQDFVQFHVWIDGAMSLADAHAVLDQVEARLERAFPGVDVIIHPDPEGHHDHPPDAEQETDLTAAIEETR